MLSENIRNYRKENNMSQDELAEKLDVSRQSVSLWENGQTQPTIDNIIALSKIFNVSANELLGIDTEPIIIQPSTEKNNKHKVWLFIVLSIVIIAVAILLIMLSRQEIKPKHKNSKVASAGTSASEVVSNVNDGEKASAVKSTKQQNQSSATKSTSSKAKQTGTASATVPKKNQTTVSKPEEKFDLFTYCKNFAIQKGKLNGDYTIYQQPSSLYGGYEDEYFSLSYWGDSNMVEFCLHCPLDDTYSINFYLRMRGGYNGEYEYLSSRYYRDDGTSVRSASGSIDPAVFSENYPLNCDSYVGSDDKQNSFMEESRVGICDLIKCLKKFAEIEKMECGFQAFGFSNF